MGKSGFPEKIFGGRIRKERLDIRVVPEISGAAVDQVRVHDVVNGRVQLARKHHAADAFLGWDLADHYAGWSRETDRPAMAMGRDALHSEFHILRTHTESWQRAWPTALQSAIRGRRRLPSGRLAYRCRRRGLTRISVKETPGRNTEARPAFVTLGLRHHERGQRHPTRRTTLGMRSMPSAFTRPSRSGQVLGLEAMPMLS
jgi:hypothetical protein